MSSRSSTPTADGPPADGLRALGVKIAQRLAPLKMPFFVIADIGEPEEGKDRHRESQQEDWMQVRHDCPKEGKQDPQPPCLF